MRISLADAKGQLVELARRAEASDEVVLTQVGHRDIRQVPEPVSRKTLDRAARLALIREIQESAARNALPGPDAARSHDFFKTSLGFPNDRGRYVGVFAIVLREEAETRCIDALETADRIVVSAATFTKVI